LVLMLILMLVLVLVLGIAVAGAVNAFVYWSDNRITTLLGSTYGWTEEVASEGRYFFARQVQETGPNTVCKSDPKKLLTQEAPDSRFYGKGRVRGGDGMYDMQSQMFDQQVRPCNSPDPTQMPNSLGTFSDARNYSLVPTAQASRESRNMPHW